MNILADECVYKATVILLRSWGHDVLTAQEAGLAGKPDEEILAYAVRHERVLITIDMDFSNVRHYIPKLHKGIIVAKNAPAQRKSSAQSFGTIAEQHGSRPVKRITGYRRSEQVPHPLTNPMQITSVK